MLEVQVQALEPTAGAAGVPMKLPALFLRLPETAQSSHWLDALACRFELCTGELLVEVKAGDTKGSTHEEGGTGTAQCAQPKTGFLSMLWGAISSTFRLNKV
jgi:hypothetical protein